MTTTPGSTALQPTPHQNDAAPDFEHRRWERILSGDHYFYGSEPGPLVRRTVRYHRAFMAEGGTALDVGCGEGQDLVFLASSGYRSTGVDFIESGLNKARRLLSAAEFQAEVQHEVHHHDLRDFEPQSQFDLVIASNSLQFLGDSAEPCLNRLMSAVTPGGVIGLSLFACDAARPKVNGTIYFATLSHLLELFKEWQPCEAATLYQWNLSTGQPQLFVTLIARNAAPVKPVPITLR